MVFVSLLTQTISKDRREFDYELISSMKCPNLLKMGLPKLISFTICSATPSKIISNKPISLLKKKNACKATQASATKGSTHAN
jgi:hypothetical protein